MYLNNFNNNNQDVNVPGVSRSVPEKVDAKDNKVNGQVPNKPAQKPAAEKKIQNFAAPLIAAGAKVALGAATRGAAKTAVKSAVSNVAKSSVSSGLKNTAKNLVKDTIKDTAISKIGSSLSGGSSSSSGSPSTLG